MNKTKKILNINTLIIFTFSLLFSLIYYAGVFRSLENIINDWIQVEFTSSEKAGKKIVYLFHTDKSIIEAEKNYNIGWPWKRSMYTKMIEYLDLSGAKLIIFYNLFNDKSVHNSVGFSDDKVFADAIQKSDKVILPMAFDITPDQYNKLIKNIILKVNKKYKKNSDLKKLIRKYRDKIKLDDLSRSELLDELYKIAYNKNITSYKKKINKTIQKSAIQNIIITTDNHPIKEKLNIKCPTPILLNAVKQLGDISAEIDDDGYFRQYPLLTKVFGKYYPSIALTSAYHYLKPDKIVLKKDHLVFGKNKIPFTQKGLLKLKYYGDNKLYPKYDIIDVIVLNDYINQVYNYYIRMKIKNEINKSINFKEEFINIFGHSDIEKEVSNFYEYKKLLIKDIENYFSSLKGISSQLKKQKITNYELNLIFEKLQQNRIMSNSSISKNNYIHLKELINQVKNNLYKKDELIQKQVLYRDHQVLKKLIKLLSIDYPSILNEDNLSILNNFNENLFKDKIVLIGKKFTGSFLLRPTPFNNNETGTHINGTAIENLIYNDLITEERESIFLSFIIFITPILFFIISNHFSLFKRLVFTVFVLMFVILIGIVSFKSFNYLIDILTLLVSILITFIITTTLQYIDEKQQKQFFKGAFGQYLSPKVIDIITNDPGRLGLGGVKKEITSFFSDIEGFSSISENLSPEELTERLNDYFTEMCDIILKYDGVIDKFQGDSIVAFWGAPLNQPDHAKLACYASIDMQKRLKELNQYWSKNNKDPIETRIGINSGYAVVGNLGSKQKMDYTMIGDTVNLGSRLEGANKFFSTKIMISENTYQLIEDSIDTRFLDTIRVVGKEERINVYEVLDYKNKINSSLAELLPLYLEGVRLYKDKQFEEAIKYFLQALSILPNDGPSNTYLLRCNEYIKNPPPQSWDGVFQLKSK